MKYLLFSTVILFCTILATKEKAEAQEELQLYGFFSTHWEKLFSEPVMEGDRIVEKGAPAEFTFPFVNIMAQQRLEDHFRVFINLNGADAEHLDVQNFWGEYTLDQRLKIRLGKTYRKFGLYNEILDAVPTYYGIEPPELFDGDHLILSRTSIFMLYGSFDLGNSGTLDYAISTDNGEGKKSTTTLPIGWDLSYNPTLQWTLGISGYTSNGNTGAATTLGQGSPSSGVLPWMDKDEFTVLGGYVEGHLLDGCCKRPYGALPTTADGIQQR
jgi:hypothetical protein